MHTHVHTHTDTHIHTRAERGGDTSLNAAAEEAQLRTGLGNRKVAQIRAGFCEPCFCLCYASLCKDHAARSWAGGSYWGKTSRRKEEITEKEGCASLKEPKNVLVWYQRVLSHIGCTLHNPRGHDSDRFQCERLWELHPLELCSEQLGQLNMVVQR